jgi:peptidoglycan/xylan/chitin deacetylase (PgdA/CDA1 family)
MLYYKFRNKNKLKSGKGGSDKKNVMRQKKWLPILGGFLFSLGLLLTAPKITLAATENLIKNPSLETANGNLPANWAQGQWGKNTTVFAYPVSGHSGTKGASVQIKKYTNGDAKWYFDEIPVSPGEQYAFSDWSNSNVNTAVTAQFRLSNSFQYQYLGAISGNSQWQNFTASFTVPSGATAVTVFHIISRVGKLTVDDYSLAKEAASAGAFSEGLITFSFDDGFKSIYTNGRPILDKAGIKSTQAIITTAYTDDYYMNWTEIKAMAAAGHEIASHSRTHANLVEISETKAKQEIIGSYDDLKAQGLTPKVFVYPYGEANASVMLMVKSAGYIGARGVEESFNLPTTDKYLLMDKHVTSGVKWETIKGWIDTAVKNKQWLILELHSQDKAGGEYSNDPALLQMIVDYVKAGGIKTVTLREGIGLMVK